MRHNILTAPLRLELKFSPHLALIFILLYASGSVFLWLSVLHWSIQLFVWAVLSLSVWDEYRRHLLFYQRNALKKLVLFDSGRVSDAKRRDYAIATSSRLSPWFILLNLRDVKGGLHTLLLLRDSVADADSYRRLRIRLRRPVSQ